MYLIEKTLRIVGITVEIYNGIQPLNIKNLNVFVQKKKKNKRLKQRMSSKSKTAVEESIFLIFF